MTIITNSIYQDTDWQDEIQTIDILKKGFHSISFDEVTGDIFIKNQSAFEYDGEMYIADADELAGSVTVASYITFDGTSFNVYTTDIFTGSFEPLKNGYYYLNERILCYWDTTDIINVITQSGLQS